MSTDLTCPLNNSLSAVGRRVWYRQSQPANHEDGVQGHAVCYPPFHRPLLNGLLVLHLCLFLVCFPVCTTWRNILHFKLVKKWTYLLSKILHISGCFHLLVHLQLLFTMSSGFTQTPTDPKQVEDSRENQTPCIGFASKRRLHWKHEERWAFACIFNTNELLFVKLSV